MTPLTDRQRLLLLRVAYLGAVVFTVLGHVKHSLLVSWLGGLWAGAALVLTLLYLEIVRAREAKR